MSETNFNLKDIVKDRKAVFSFYRQGYVYYEVVIPVTTNPKISWEAYVFPIEISDLGSATLSREEKAITLMRYIRKALDDGTFVKA